MYGNSDEEMFNAMYAPRFAEYTDEELWAELDAQRELMGGWKQTARRNPYYNPGPGLNRLQELEEELAARNSHSR